MEYLLGFDHEGFSDIVSDLKGSKIRAGIRRARLAGKHIGRPKRPLNLHAARLLLSEGYSMRDTARKMGVPRTTLRRRLAS